MSVLELDVRDAAQEAFRWWWRELSSLVPGANARSDSLSTPDLVVESEGEQWVAMTGNAREDAIAAIAERVRRGRKPRVRLRLTPSQVLYRETIVPRRVSADIPKIAALAMERTMPLPALAVTGDYLVATAPNDPNALVIRQAVARRAKIEEGIRQIEAAGALVDAVDCRLADGSVLPVDLTPGRAAAARARAQRSDARAAFLLGIVALLALSALYVTAVRKEEALSELTTEVSELKRRLDADTGPAAALDGVAEAKRALAEFKATRPEAVRVLAEITRRLPDSAWLTSVKIAEDSVDIAGFGKPAAALAPLLERSPLFRSAALTAPVALDETWGKERFNIRLVLNVTKSEADGVAPDAPAEPVGPPPKGEVQP